MQRPAVNYTVTEPAAPTLKSALVAFGAEFVMCFLLLLLALVALHSACLKQWTGWLLGALLALYVVVEVSLSSMSLNPARTPGTAVAASSYEGL